MISLLNRHLVQPLMAWRAESARRPDILTPPPIPNPPVAPSPARLPEADMRAMRGLVTVMAVTLAMSGVLRAQMTAPAVDRLFRISGMLPGPVPAGPAPVVLGIDDGDVDGAPIWQEVQTVPIGPGGLYTVLVLDH